MVYIPPETLTLQRDLVIHGSLVPQGTELTEAEALSLPHLDALVSKGWIKADPETYARKFVGPSPATTLPGVRSGSIVVVEDPEPREEPAEEPGEE